VRKGYAVDFCTDLDIHAQPSLLQDYRLLLSVGHDEYWTEEARDAVEDFVADGGNLTLFGANLCWWRIHLVDDGTAMVCHQGSKHGAFDHWWPRTGAGRPEDDHMGQDGLAVLSAWRDEAGTPDGYQLLAACPLDQRWQELPPRERHGAGEGVHVAAMGSFRKGGTVFSAGTTDWAQVLGDARDRRVERITCNVLDRLSQA